jgi:hypothetical protein
MPKLPPNPLYAFFLLPRGRLLKVHAEPCMYAPGYLQSNRPRWPGVMTESLRACGVAPIDGGKTNG